MTRDDIKFMAREAGMFWFEYTLADGAERKANELWHKYAPPGHGGLK